MIRTNMKENSLRNFFLRSNIEFLVCGFSPTDRKIMEEEGFMTYSGVSHQGAVMSLSFYTVYGS